MSNNYFKRKVNHHLQVLHYQKIGVLLAEPKSEKRDKLIEAIKQKLKVLDDEGWEIFKQIVKL